MTNLYASRAYGHTAVYIPVNALIERKFIKYQTNTNNELDLSNLNNLNWGYLLLFFFLNLQHRI